MRHRRVGAVISAVLVGSVLTTGPAAGQTLVDCNGTGSLQAAIDAAPPSSVIDFTGTCVENLLFASDDVLDIVGIGGAVIDGSGAAASAVTIPTGAFVTFFDVTITGGSGDFGGGIDNSGDLGIVDSVIEFNTADVSGGAIDSLGPLGIWDSVIRNNTGDLFGGGIVSRDEATLTRVEVYDNVATDGGGVTNRGVDLFIFDSSIHDNEATFGLGGGIYNDFGSTLFVDTSAIFANETMGGLGGGIYNGDGFGGGGGDVFLFDSVISGNGAGGGGGVFNEGGSLLLSETTIQDHVSSSGAAITNTLDGDTLLLGSRLINNNAGTGGGGIFSDSGTVDIFDSTLSGNTAEGLAPGGAIFNTGDSALLIGESTISGNTADSGGGIYNESPASVSLTGSTVAGNTATGASTGGGINNAGGTASIGATIVADNVSPTGPDCAGVITSAGYNLVEATSGCTFAPLATDLTGVDPLLGPLVDNGGPTPTRALSVGSPAIDHIPTVDCSAGFDQRGIVRPRGSGCDIGAFELDGTPDVVVLVEPNGRWHLRRAGEADLTFFYGVPGDVPLFGDWNGDGLDTPGMWRQGPGGGFAYLTDTLPGDGEVAVAEFDYFFGNPGDEVFSGDWNGDGVDTLGINRRGHVFLSDENGSFGAPVPTDYDFWFGVLGDRAFGGDPDGDGRDSVFLYRETDGFVYYTNDTPAGPGAVAATADNFFFGIASDSFVSGDWDGDQDDTAGIFRGSDTTVYLSNTNASGGAAAPTDDSYVWGTAGWIPVAGVWE